MRILLVEDDPQIGSAIASALEDAGMVADWVTDGNAALASVEAGAFELILLDIGLPKKDGLSVLKQIRQRQPNGHNLSTYILFLRQEPSLDSQRVIYGTIVGSLKTPPTCSFRHLYMTYYRERHP